MLDQATAWWHRSTDPADPRRILWPCGGLLLWTAGEVALGTAGLFLVRAMTKKHGATAPIVTKVQRRVGLLWDNVSNLKEVPPVWYAACAASYLSGGVTQHALYASWGYLASRVLHSVIHVGTNDVRGLRPAAMHLTSIFFFASWGIVTKHLLSEAWPHLCTPAVAASLLPCAAMAWWTGAVLYTLFFSRGYAVAKKLVDVEFFETNTGHGGTATAPALMILTNDAFNSLVGGPAVFYGAAVANAYLAPTSALALCGSWSFVAMRSAHSVAILTTAHPFERVTPGVSAQAALRAKPLLLASNALLAGLCGLVVWNASSSL